MRALEKRLGLSGLNYRVSGAIGGGWACFLARYCILVTEASFTTEGIRGGDD